MMERRSFLSPAMNKSDVKRASVEFEVSPRIPRRLRPLVLLPSLVQLVDAMDGAPFRFYGEDCFNGIWRWSAERARG